MEPTQITIEASAFIEYKRTLARFEPETGGIVAGRLDRPNHISEFRFVRPAMKDGRYDASYTHYAPDAELMNWINNNEYKPNGLHILGVWHSHPSRATSPSGDGGDLGFFKDCLGHEEARECGWTRLLAPITTFDEKGRDRIHPYVYNYGDRGPIPASLKVLHGGKEYTPEAFDRLERIPTSATTNEAATALDEAELMRPDVGLRGLVDFLIEFEQEDRRVRRHEELGFVERLRVRRNMRRILKKKMQTTLKAQSRPHQPPVGRREIEEKDE